VNAKKGYAMTKRSRPVYQAAYYRAPWPSRVKSTHDQSTNPRTRPCLCRAMFRFRKALEFYQSTDAGLRLDERCKAVKPRALRFEEFARDPQVPVLSTEAPPQIKKVDQDRTPAN